jgi:hypothetical protein
MQLQFIYEGVSRSFRTANGTALGHYVQLYRYFMRQYSEFSIRNPCVASQRVFIVVSVYFVIDPVRKLLDTPTYTDDSCLLYKAYEYT